jgi:ferredoxin
MPKVRIVESPVGPDKEVEVEAGTDLVDAADQHWLPIPFSCRSASCATCQVQVIEGADLLEPPGEDETELLELIGAGDNWRLACQVRLGSGDGVVKLKPA